MNNTIIHCPTQDLYDRIVEKYGWYNGYKHKDYWRRYKEETSVEVDGGKIQSYCELKHHKSEFPDYTFTTAEEVLATPNGGIMSAWHQGQSIPELLETWDNVMIQNEDNNYSVITNKKNEDGDYIDRLYDSDEEEAKEAKESVIAFGNGTLIEDVKNGSLKILYPFNNEPKNAEHSSTWSSGKSETFEEARERIKKEVINKKPMLKQLSNTLKRVLSKELRDQYRAGLINDSMELSNAGREIMLDALSQLPSVQEALNVEAKRIIKEDK